MEEEGADVPHFGTSAGSFGPKTAHIKQFTHPSCLNHKVYYMGSRPQVRTTAGRKPQAKAHVSTKDPQ